MRRKYMVPPPFFVIFSFYCKILFFSYIFWVGFGTDKRIFSEEIGLEKGMTAPDFFLSDLKGGEKRLSEFMEKKIILNFWSIWCKPCREEMPFIEEFYRTNKSKGIEILSINIDKEPESFIKALVQKMQLTFPVLLDPRKKVSRMYGVFALPTTYLIDSKRTIMGKCFGKLEAKNGLFFSFTGK